MHKYLLFASLAISALQQAPAPPKPKPVPPQPTYPGPAYCAPPNVNVGAPCPTIPSIR